MTPEELSKGSSLRRIGRTVIVRPEATSTNELALEAASRPELWDLDSADGLAVFADVQTAGRGRQGRTWLSPRAASVLCSVVILHPDPTGSTDENPDGASNLGGRLTLISAVAACEAIRRATTVAPAIKWPNDLRVGGRKLGGVLIESRRVDPPARSDDVSLDPAAARAWVIGIGINCLQQTGHFPADLQATATSLEIVSRHPVERLAVARALLRALDAWLAEPEPAREEAHAAWLKYAEPIGQRVRLLHRGEVHVGRTVAVDPDGGLIVQNETGGREWFDPQLTTIL